MSKEDAVAKAIQDAYQDFANKTAYEHIQMGDLILKHVARAATAAADKWDAEQRVRSPADQYRLDQKPMYPDAPNMGISPRPRLRNTGRARPSAGFDHEGGEVSEMIERVARALFDASQLRLSATLTNEVLYGRSDVTWELLNSSEVIPGIVESYRKQARAAIEAMREPTESMIYAGNGESGHGRDIQVWQAMIDVALEGK